MWYEVNSWMVKKTTTTQSSLAAYNYVNVGQRIMIHKIEMWYPHKKYIQVKSYA